MCYGILQKLTILKARLLNFTEKFEIWIWKLKYRS